MNKNLKDSKTYYNLAKAFAGESMARSRYQFMEYGARQQGLCALADVIKTIEVNEFNHARMFYTYLQDASTKTIDNIDIEGSYPFKQKWDFIENFAFAVEDESSEANEIYPEFANIAEEEGFTEIAALFRMVASVETCHMNLLNDIREQLESKTLYSKEKKEKWKCKVCGYEYESKEALEQCPLCESPIGEVMLILNDNK